MQASRSNTWRRTLCAAALVLREVCSLEGLGIAAGWRTTAPISQTPLYLYSLVLVVDTMVFSLLALVAVEVTQRTRPPVLRRPGPSLSRPYLGPYLRSL